MKHRKIDLKEILKGTLICVIPLTKEPLDIEVEGVPIYYFPETGRTPKELSEFVPKRFNTAGVVVTTCPLLVSDFKPEEVFISTESDGFIHPDFNTFGAGTDLITAKLFKYSDSFGGRARATLNEFYARKEANEDPQSLIDEIYRTLGDSAERVFLIHGLIEKRGKKV